jgi:hypothetical protein
MSVKINRQNKQLKNDRIKKKQETAGAKLSGFLGKDLATVILPQLC